MKKTIRFVVALDLGDRVTSTCVLDTRTGETRADSVRTTKAAMTAFFAACPRSRVAMETGTHSPWVSRLAASAGHEVIVAHARAIRAIWDTPKKHDRRDAELLAELAASPRVKLLQPVTHRSEAAQEALTALRLRESAVDARTKLANAVRGVVKSMGERLPACSTAAFPRVAGEHELPPALRRAVAPMLDAIAQLTRSIRDYDRQIDELCAQHPVTGRLREVDGVGPVTSLAFVLVLDDPSRFTRSRDVGAYVGVVPRLDQSGTIDKQLGITKCGDRMLRRLLVQCAHRILGPHGQDSDLRRWGLALAERGGKNAKKRAVVAVARKLAVLLHALWVRDRPYEPLRKTREAA